MGLSVKHLQNQMSYELGGGSLPTQLDAVGVLNQAGHHLYSMHPWRWAVGRTALIDLRGALSGSTATWTASTKTLTQASAFTNYSWLTGDEISITSGTGATTGVYKIASRTSANAITLASSLSSTDLATGDIAWRIEPQTMALPTDLRDIIAISSTNNSAIGGVSLTTLEEIVEKRKSSASVTASTGFYYATVVYNGSPPRPLLEIYPSANANITGAMRMFYRSRWVAPTGDSEQIDIPDFMHDLMILLARAYASGYVRNDAATLNARLGEIHAGPIFEVAKRSDGMIQPYHGVTKNGGATIWRRKTSPFPQITNRIAAPTI